MEDARKAAQRQGPSTAERPQAASEAAARTNAAPVKPQRGNAHSPASAVTPKAPAEGTATPAPSRQDSGDAQADTRGRQQRQASDHRQRGTAAPTPQRARTNNRTSAAAAPAFAKTAAMELALDPKPTTTGASSDTEASPEKILSGTSDGGASSANTARTKAPQATPGFTRPDRALAWLQARGAAPRSAMGSARDGWRMLEMRLQDGDGSLTIKTKQEDDRMAVSVNFSDPRLRSVASANAQQIQNVLQSQYNTTVDLSLMSDGQGSAEGELSDGSGSGGASPRTAETDTDTSESTATRAPLLGGQHEWVG